MSIMIRYHTSNYCAIGDDNEVVLTGGSAKDLENLVTRYNMEGKVTTLPSLKTGRMVHTCGKFTNKNGETVIHGSKNAFII